MEKIVFLILFFLLLIPLVLSLTITCEVGGPYIRPPTITVTGNVTQLGVGTVANVSLKIYKEGVLRVKSSGTSDSDGYYYFVIDGSGLEIGEYSVNLTADNGTYLANCSDTFTIQVAPSPTCEQTDVLIQGRAMYAGGGIIDSGKVAAAFAETKYQNSTSFSDGRFSIILSACLYRGKRYMLVVQVSDSENRKGTSQIIFSLS